MRAGAPEGGLAPYATLTPASHAARHGRLRADNFRIRIKEGGPRRKDGVTRVFYYPCVAFHGEPEPKANEGER